MRVTGAVLVVPVMEELFWRSFLMRWIDRRGFLEMAPEQVSWVGILASSAVFALAHDLWLAGLLAGVVYALLYRQLGNIWYSIIAHATTNLALAGWVLWRGAWQYW
jgi:CAAX prenyl protease-like protein